MGTPYLVFIEIVMEEFYIFEVFILQLSYTLHPISCTQRHYLYYYCRFVSTDVLSLPVP